MNVLKTTQKIICPCGSTIACKSSLPRHLKTKRHQRFEETGETSPKTQAEYQKRYYNKNPEARMKHRQLCQRYYAQNKEAIRERQSKNGAVRRYREKLKTRE